MGGGGGNTALCSGMLIIGFQQDFVCPQWETIKEQETGEIKRYNRWKNSWKCTNFNRWIKLKNLRKEFIKCPDVVTDPTWDTTYEMEASSHAWQDRLFLLQYSFLKDRAWSVQDQICMLIRSKSSSKTSAARLCRTERGRDLCGCCRHHLKGPNAWQRQIRNL